ncbi:MAG: SCO family protein [Chloroflexi bacterium]|nr:SCO family protein [Chloroflexota bacterium]
MRNRVSPLALVLLVALLAACVSVSSTLETIGVTITDPWVRPPAGPDRPAAAYVTIEATGDRSDALLAVSSPAAARCEVHETTMDSTGMAGMHPIERLEIPAGASVKLEPGGYHIMLMEPQELAVGDTVELRLEFEKAGTVTVTAEVRGADMGPRSDVPGPSTSTAPSMDGAFRLVVAMVVVLVAVIGTSVVGGALRPAATGTPAPALLDPASFLYPDPRPAPPLELVDQDGAPFSAARYSGATTLVFFGYTHCPDVCPATTGVLTEAAASYGPGVRVVFVSVDPERDTVDWLNEYVRYLPAGFSALTGTPAEVRTAADGWGVRYARVETDIPGEYSMSHTAEVYLVDGTGTLRAHFPFGSQAEAIVATMRLVAAANPASPAASPASTPAGPTREPSPTATETLTVEVASSSIWAGGASPVILALSGPSGRLADLAADVAVQATSSEGVALGVPVRGVAVRPPGVDAVSYVAVVDLDAAGLWGLAVTARSGGASLDGWTSIAALDPGATAQLGAGAPDVHTPTLDDVEGAALRVTTDPLPDLRLSRTSTTDALAAGEPFVLVVDSSRFRVTPACGKALALAKFLLNRWPDVPFIHLEPYAYEVVTEEPVIQGSLAAPVLVPAADAWGTGAVPWGAGSMPWVFVVDGDGTVVAKYQGVVGSDDIDVIVAMLVARG